MIRFHRRKRARCCERSFERVDLQSTSSSASSSSSSSSATNVSCPNLPQSFTSSSIGATTAIDNDDEEDRRIPKGYVCPLTLEVMLDPVLDAEGNTYERDALLKWLKTSRTSPISRQPLSERMILPNIALREAIHEYMGANWVQQKTKQQRLAAANAEHDKEESTTTNTATAAASHFPRPSVSRFRAKVELYLEYINHTFNNVSLQLNEHGCCAFRYHDFTVVLDVPEKVGVFCLYTRDMIPSHYLTPSMKTLLLELNFLQGDTRGGCLSVNRSSTVGRESSSNEINSGGASTEQAEVLFSYTDRVTEVSAQEFANILLNFVETALQLRNRLLCHYASEQHQLAAAASFQQQQPQPSSSSTTSDESSCCMIFTGDGEECTVLTDHAVMSRCSQDDDDTDDRPDAATDQEQHVQRLLLQHQQQQQQYLLQQQNLDRLVRRLEAITEQAKRHQSTPSSSSSSPQRTWY